MVAVHPSGPEGPPTIIEMKYVQCDNTEDLDREERVRKETTYYYNLLLVEFVKRLRWIYYIRLVDYGEGRGRVCETGVIIITALMF